MGDETTAPAGMGEAEPEREPPDPARIEIARKITRALTRSVSAQRLYAKRNEIVSRTLAELANEFEVYLKRFGTLRIEVGSLEFRVGGECIHKDAKREGSFPHRLYRDGIRELVFLEGLSQSEIEDFVDLLMKEGGEGGLAHEDLVTLLWKRDFSSIDYVAIEDISYQVTAEGDEENESDAGARDARNSGDPSERIHAPGMSLDELLPGLEKLTEHGQARTGGYTLALGFIDLDNPIFQGPGGEEPHTDEPGLTAKSEAQVFLDLGSVPIQELGEEARAAGVASLFQLTATEQERLRAEIAGDGPNRLWSIVHDLVFELLVSGDPSIREESYARILVPSMRATLVDGDFDSINAVFEHLDRISQDGPRLGSTTKQTILAELASPENVRSAVIAFLGDPAGKGEALVAHLNRLPRGSIDSLLALYQEIKGKEAGALIRDFILERSAGDPVLTAWILDSEHNDLIEGALSIVRSTKPPDALALLSKTVSHANQGVRMKALQVLGDFDGPQAADLVVLRLQDPVTEVRLVAIKVLSTRRLPAVVEELMARVRATGFEELIPRERAALFHAVASAGGDRVVPFLEERLRKRSGFWKTRAREDRRLAALALGSIGSPAALAALNRGASSRDRTLRGICEWTLKRLNDNPALHPGE